MTSRNRSISLFLDTTPSEEKRYGSSQLYKVVKMLIVHAQVADVKNMWILTSSNKGEYRSAGNTDSFKTEFFLTILVVAQKTGSGQVLLQKPDPSFATPSR